MNASRERRLLLAGAILGVALAILSLVHRPEVAPLTSGADVVAEVGGRTIGRVDYERALEAVALDRREGLAPEDRSRVLERLIDEELLVQAAIELGLAERDPRTRADLTSAMLALIRARAEEEAPPDESELGAHLEANAEYFAGPAQLRVRHVFFHDDAGASALERAGDARSRLEEGETVEGDAAILPLGTSPLTPRRLAEALGDAASRRALELETNEWSAPLCTAEGCHLILVLERHEPSAPPLDSIRDLVRVDYIRRSGERALDRFLAERRASTPIDVDESLR